MRVFLWVSLISFFVSGCVGDGPSPEIVAVIKEREQNNALALAHKITFVEAARRSNEAVEKATGGRLTDQDRLLMSYRSALASEVDAGQMTFEMAGYRYEEKKAEFEAQDTAERGAAVAALGESMQAIARAAQPLPTYQLAPTPSPFATRLQTTCMSNALGNTVTTTCN